jgi:hypothetical protein
MAALVQAEANNCSFYAVFCRVLKRPEDIGRNTVTGSVMLWVSSCIGFFSCCCQLLRLLDC